MRNLKMIISILFLAVLFNSCEKTQLLLSGEGPEIEIKDEKAYVNGVLGKTFYRKFKRLIKNNPNIKTLVLEDVPGSINDEWNTKTCILLHENGFNTELYSYSEIASGGVDLFISGNKRSIASGARIGVHSWSDGKKDGNDYPKEFAEHNIFIDLFEKIDMDLDFYWFTLQAAPANDIYWMSESEIDLYELSNN